MQTKNILIFVVVIGLAALVVMLVAQQQPQQPLQESGTGFIPDQAQKGPPPADNGAVPQEVEIVAPSGGEATGTGSLLPQGEATTSEENAASQPETAKPTSDEPSASALPDATVVQTATVEMSDIGFAPSALALSAGTTVTFKNVGTRPMWPASAMHPTHGVYPTKGGCLGSTFDACRGLKPGETWSFKFDEKGTWGYHDHLNPSTRGEISIE